MRLLAISGLLLASLGAGCDTIKSDFASLGESFTPPSPAQAAQWALDPYDAENRRRGTTLLAAAPWGGSEAYLTMYRDRLMNETDPQVLAISIRALARHGNPGDALAIAAHAEDESEEVRWEAARGLQRLYNVDVIDVLVDRLVDINESVDVRREAAVALGQYADDRAFQALVTALDAQELGVNEAAQKSLTQLTGKDYSLDRRAWLGWYRDDSAPFAGQKTYLFPTYSRRLGIGDYLTFWNPPVFETPAPPAGLRDEGARSTYGAPAK